MFSEILKTFTIYYLSLISLGKITIWYARSECNLKFNLFIYTVLYV